ncbi:ABC transporter ATP-binding protein [Eubacteriaceae bacterium ES2]|nr:ABC transporter ATP-binding protein [Eubacteriaceae bacterium ES2]
MKAIEVRELYFRYAGEKTNTLHDLSFELKKTEILAIAGHSGCGKSTLCHILAGIIPKTIRGKIEGEIEIFGQSLFSLDTPQLAKNVGIVFQEPDNQLFSPTIEAEIAFGPENLCIERQETGRRIEEMLALVGMQKYRYDSPNDLSGGQKQLIALASVLSMKPQILLFDEALSQIDNQGRQRMKQVILQLKNDGHSVLMVEHDFENMEIADRILVLKNGQLSPYSGSL